MKVNLFNHWFKYKVPVEKHWDLLESKITNVLGYHHPWKWLDEQFDVGQYYKVSEGRNYMVFHNKKHYINCLLRWS